MPGGINEVQLIGLSVLGLVMEGDTLGLDGDAPFTLQVHGVQHLGLHFPIRKPTAVLDETIRQGRFSMVNVGNDGKIANVTQCGQSVVSWAGPKGPEFERRRSLPYRARPCMQPRSWPVTAQAAEP